MPRTHGLAKAFVTLLATASAAGLVATSMNSIEHLDIAAIARAFDAQTDQPSCISFEGHRK
jgi:hypothetical protein